MSAGTDEVSEMNGQFSRVAMKQREARIAMGEARIERFVRDETDGVRLVAANGTVVYERLGFMVTVDAKGRETALRLSEREARRAAARRGFEIED
jgi:hypothetical protein